jgi:hypothetical protein
VFASLTGLCTVALERIAINCFCAHQLHGAISISENGFLRAGVDRLVAMAVGVSTVLRALPLKEKTH